jgi:hypothetical protein
MHGASESYVTFALSFANRMRVAWAPSGFALTIEVRRVVAARDLAREALFALATKQNSIPFRVGRATRQFAECGSFVLISSNLTFSVGALGTTGASIPDSTEVSLADDRLTFALVVRSIVNCCDLSFVTWITRTACADPVTCGFNRAGHSGTRSVAIVSVGSSTIGNGSSCWTARAFVVLHTEVRIADHR